MTRDPSLRVEQPADTGQCETPMADHVARFWDMLANEREIGHDAPDGPTIYWDGSTFSNDVAKAIPIDRRSIWRVVANLSSVASHPPIQPQLGKGGHESDGGVEGHALAADKLIGECRSEPTQQANAGSIEATTTSEAGIKPGPSDTPQAQSTIEPHLYSPDYQAMGDCRVCGHQEDVPHHIDARRAPQAQSLREGKL